MDISTYETISGTSVPTARESYVQAMIAKAKLEIENKLGYSLDSTSSSSTRKYPFNINDLRLVVDPCTNITSVTLYNDSELVYTFTTDEYREVYTGSHISALEMGSYFRLLCTKSVELRVTATWQFATVPADIKMVWADLVTYLIDPTNNIKSQTLGTHTYTKGTTRSTIESEYAVSILTKYAGPLGSIARIAIT